MTTYLGDYVKTPKHGFRGRVNDVHHCCPETDMWLEGQANLGVDPFQYRNVRWISILVDGGGSIATPDLPEFVEHTDAFELQNSWADEYFRS